MLSNCKKHSMPKWKKSSDLPLGVRDTPEESFKEYKMIKEADILNMATKYKNKVPRHIYDALLKVEVKPY